MRSSLANIQSVGDPAQVWNFALFLPSIPGSSDTRDLTFKCQTADLPGGGLEPVEVNLSGVTLKFAGRAIYTHTMNVTMLETADWMTREKIRRWRDTARSWKTNSGSSSAVYKVNALMELYDDTPSVVRTVQIYGLWPETIAEVNLDGGQSAAVIQTITFQYDYWDDV